MAISFRAAAHASGNTPQGKATVTVPATVQAGDVLVAVYGAHSQAADTGGQAVIADPTGVTGWTAFGSQVALSQGVAKAWWKIADGSEASAHAVFGYTGDTLNNWGSASIAAWSGSDRTTPLAVISAPSSDATSSTAHVCPTISTTGKGSCWIASIFTGQCGNVAMTTLTPSSGWTARDSNITATFRWNTLIVDSAGDVAAGTGKGGATITADQPSNANVEWTFAIAELAAVQTARPNADITTAGWTPSTTPGAGVPLCSLLADSSDTTYVTSAAAPSAQDWEAAIPAMSAPPNTVTNRVYFGGGAVSGTVVTKLMQGATVIASRTDTWASNPPVTPVDLTITLTSGQQAAITDLTALSIRATVTAA
jgi:hypothetical protein